MIIDRNDVARSLAGITTRKDDIDGLHREYVDRWEEAERQLRTWAVASCDRALRARLENRIKDARASFLMMHLEALNRMKEVKLENPLSDEAEPSRSQIQKSEKVIEESENGLFKRWKRSLARLRPNFTAEYVKFPNLDPVEPARYARFKSTVDQIRADLSGTVWARDAINCLKRQLSESVARDSRAGMIATVNMCLGYLMANNDVNGEFIFPLNTTIWTRHKDAARMAFNRKLGAGWVAVDVPFGFAVVADSEHDTLWLFNLPRLTDDEVELLKQHGWTFHAAYNAWAGELTQPNLTLLELFASNWRRFEHALVATYDPSKEPQPAE